MTTINTKNLAAWIDDLKEAAKDDSCFSIAKFKDTENMPFCIVAGWQKGFSDKYDDLLCVSKSEPEYAMCVKIAINENQLCPDFETIRMPMDANGYVDDTCIALEQEDDSESFAAFLLCEFERIMAEHVA